MGEFMRRLERSGIEPVTRAALLLTVYTGLRDAALRAAKWKEIDLKHSVWHVPGERMKSGRDFDAPLPKQAVKELKELAKLTRRTDENYIFASHGKHGYLAENTLRIALHRMRFNVTAHGFRSTITDLLNEAGFNPDAIERQMDHVAKNKVRGAYLRSDFIHERTRMTQWLADYCDAQRDEKEPPSNVVALR